MDMRCGMSNGYINDYGALGMHLLKTNGKLPVEKGYTQSGFVSGIYYGDYSNANGLGLLHKPSGTCAIDVDAYDEAVNFCASRKVDLARVLASGIRITHGDSTRAKAIYRLPYHKPAYKLVVDGKTVLELRCVTKSGTTQYDVLPPTIHPSGEPYRWTDGMPTHVPELPESIIALWDSLTDASTLEASREASRLNTHGLNANASNVRGISDNVLMCLRRINPDVDYDVWISVGMALHSTGSPDAFSVWDKWSSHGKKYRGSDDLSRHWVTFRRDKPNGVTVRTIEYLAGGDIDQVANRFLGNGKKTFVLSGNNFPPLMASIISQVSSSVGVTFTTAVPGALAAISAVTNGQSRLELGGRSINPAIWTMLRGDPGTKKSPAVYPFVQSVNRISDAVKPLVDQEKAEYHKQLIIYNRDLEKLEKLINKDDPLAFTMGAPVKPVEPSSYQYVLNNVTSQSMMMELIKSPEGRLLYLDESNYWLRELGSTHGTENRSQYILAYEGGKYTALTIKHGKVSANNVSLSILLLTQPKVLEKYSDNMKEDGIYQRFMIFDSERVKGYVDSGHTVDFSAWDKRLMEIHNAGKMTYYLSKDANVLFLDYVKSQSERIDYALSQEVDMSDYLSIFSKLDALLLKLALLFHVSEMPICPVICESSMRLALGVVRDYSGNELPGGVELINEDIIRAVASLASRRSLSSSSIARQAAKYCGTTKPRALYDTIDFLVDSGWLIPRGGAGANTASRRTYIFNPTVRNYLFAS